VDVYLAAISWLTATLSLISNRSFRFSQGRGEKEKKENLHFFKKNRKNGDFIDKTQVMGISRILSPQVSRPDI